MTLIDREENEPAINYDGTEPKIIDNHTVLIKDLGCNCDPSSGNMCGGCVDSWEEHPIGPNEKYFWGDLYPTALLTD